MVWFGDGKYDKVFLFLYEKKNNKRNKKIPYSRVVVFIIIATLLGNAAGASFQ